MKNKLANSVLLALAAGLGLASCAKEPAAPRAAAPLGASADATAPVVAVNSGGPAAGAFQADAFFGGFNVANGITSSTAAAIDTSARQAAPARVYQSQRKGNGSYFVYRFGQGSGLKDGQKYRLRLHFAEIDYTRAGQRQFNVVLNGNTRLLTNFDIVAEAGAPNKAVVKQFSFVARASTSGTGNLFLRFDPGAAGEPTVSGIEVLPAR